MGEIIDKGELISLIPYKRYIVIKPQDQDRAAALLSAYAKDTGGIDIDIERFILPVSRHRHVVVLASGDPRFYFGIGENTLLNRQDPRIVNFVAEGRGESRPVSSANEAFRTATARSFMSPTVNDIKKDARSVFWPDVRDRFMAAIWRLRFGS